MPGMLNTSPSSEFLNTEQRLAVETNAERVLILAGAGSGKTRVLVRRIAHLIETGQALASHILAVTFTNKAASEMRKRVDDLLGPRGAGLWMGTFHSLCHRILRSHAAEAGLPREFQILDYDDQLRLVKRIIKSLQIDDDYVTPKEALSFISKQKEEGKRFQHLERARDLYYQTLYSIYQTYELELVRLGQVDFAELILKTQELLQQNESILNRYQSQFQHVLVDEFQDTNRLQYQWLKLLSQHHLFVVGDDDQSIYGWRGAQIRNLKKFQDDYPNAVLIKLEQNYRSTATILNASNALIAHNADRFGKALWTHAGSGEPIGIYDARSDLEEARFVAERIGYLHGLGTSLSDFAILYRSNAQSRLLEEALLKTKLPYRIFGGLRFFERAEIKDVLAYLRLAFFVQDDAAFERVVNWPTRGIGEQSVEVLRQEAQKTQTCLLENAQKIAAGFEHPELSKRAQNAIALFAQLIQSIADHLKSHSLSQTLKFILDNTQLIPQFQKAKDGKGENRIENLNELIEASRQFEASEDGEALPTSEQTESFLTHAVLEAGDHQADPDQDAINLMTMHAAKGLEFNTVFLVGMEEGLFPHQMAMQEDNLSEERRLCYVAMTRAKKHLILTHALSRRLYGMERHNAPSRFLREIPDSFLKSIRTKSSSVSVSFGDETIRRTRITHSAAIPLGKRVEHVRFGEGVILDQQGEGSEKRVLVSFKSGQKWLMSEKANLKVLP